MRVEPLTDFLQRFDPGATVWAGGKAYVTRRARLHGEVLLLELEGIDTREEAERLRGLLLEVPEESLPALAEGQYFRFQVLGLDVFDRRGHSLGRIEEILKTGANDVYIVRDAESELLIPAIDTVVKEVDLGGRRMVVELIEGLERRPLPPR